MATEHAGFCPSPATQRTERVFERLNTGNPKPSWAVQWCEAALSLYREDGDMINARRLLRGALFNRAHPETIFHEWIDIEADHAGDLDAPRMRFEEWRSLAGDCLGDSSFWCHYIAFEVDHRDARRARRIAEVALKACPCDPKVYAKYAKAELLLGRADRARAVVRRALDVFDADANASARKWLEDEMEGYSNSMREGKLTIRNLFRFYCRGCGHSAAP